MAALSLRDAAEQTGVGMSTVWRAITSGRLSATRTDDGGFAIDPAELFRVFEPGRSARCPEGQDATAPPSPSAMDETGLKQALAVAEANLQALRDMLAEVKASRDEIRADRDAWQAQAERLALARLSRPPAPAATPEAAAPITGLPANPVSAPEPRRSWFRWWFGWRAA